MLYGTLVTLADGRRVPIETLEPGTMVRSLVLPGLRTDVPFRAQYEWMSTWGLEGATVGEGRVSEVRLGEHDGFWLINRRIKATFEHPFLVRRDDEWGFCSAELLRVGDNLVTLVEGRLKEERVDALERIIARARSVAIYVPGTNTYVADGAWTHNDVSGSASTSLTGLSSGSSSSGSGSGSGSSSSGSGGGSSSSGSGGGKGSGSSFSSGSGSSSSGSISGSSGSPTISLSGVS